MKAYHNGQFIHGQLFRRFLLHIAFTTLDFHGGSQMLSSRKLLQTIDQR